MESSSSSSSSSSSAVKKPYFLGEDCGLASLADTEAGVSGMNNINNNNNNNYNHQNCPFSRSVCYTRRNMSLRNLYYQSVSSSPRSVRFYDARFERHQPHFLESCALCKKQLGDNSDIFMYRGDTPFCSEECRQEEIENDEAKEKNRKLSSSMKALKRKEQKTKSASPNKYAFRIGTTVAAA